MKYAFDENTEYKEILELNNFCIDIGINAKIEPLIDGYKLLFPNGSDMVQHRYSHGSWRGCIEPAIGCDFDYSAVPPYVARMLVIKYCDKLNKEAVGG
jgi:hypothetical protein